MSRSSDQAEGAEPRTQEGRRPRSPSGVLQDSPKDRPLLDFHVRVHQSASRLKVTYGVRNPSAHEAYLQNRFGPPQDCALGRVGGGRSVNETTERRAQFACSSACTWPTKDGTLVLFQGDVPPAQLPTPSDWSEPAYSKIGRDETKFEIELSLPIRQWENNMAREADGPIIKVRRLSVCVDVLLDPLSVLELPSLPGVFACDYGQPGYLEATVELDRAVDVITMPSLASRGEAKLASLKTLVRLGALGPKSVAKPATTP